MFSADYMIYYALVGVLTMIGMWVSNRLKSKFAKYSQIGIRSGLSGKEAAERMLRHYNISDVRIVRGEGFLSDHYNPLTKTVSLSPDVHDGRSIAAAAVAAHECGHAVQHDQAYAMLQVRSTLVPFVKFASMAQGYLLMLALMLAGSMPGLLFIVIIAFSITTLFSFVTLPVEFDASQRALVWLEESGVTTGAEHDGAKDALWWAAMTYVSAALSSLVILLYLVLRYGSNR
ncbi:MAG: zinc metallopeptidase [Bacteroidota bacterium]